MYTSESEYEQDLEPTKKMLKETYIGNIVYVQERSKEGADEEELKAIEEIIMATERLIVYFDQSDEWVKNLHEEAKRNAGEVINGTSDDSGDEFDRLEKAGNFKRSEDE
jgi:hypothetical protein